MNIYIVKGRCGMIVFYECIWEKFKLVLSLDSWNLVHRQAALQRRTGCENKRRFVQGGCLTSFVNETLQIYEIVSVWNLRIFARFCFCWISRHGDGKGMDRRLQSMFQTLKLWETSCTACLQWLTRLGQCVSVL